MRSRIPGPYCSIRNEYVLDDGTTIRFPSPVPGPLGVTGSGTLAGGASRAGEPVVLTGEMLRQIVPGLGDRAGAVAADLTLAMQEAGISTVVGQAMFIAQLAHESAGFKTMEERGGKTQYTREKYKEKEADDKWYDYFFFMYDKDSPSPRRRKVAAALGNTEAGDGAKYHGRGYIQITGRNNYRAAGDALKLDLENNPALAAEPAIAARIAAWFWKTNKLNQLTQADSARNFKELTRRINGGYNGLSDRISYFERAKMVLMGRSSTLP